MQYKWTRTDIGVQESRPYVECPRCGEYQFTIRREKVRSGLISYSWEELAYCHHCKLEQAGIPAIGDED